MRNQRIYVYKCVVDDGGAPCIDGDLLTLTICKPYIRSTARPGDLIFAFGSNAESPANRLVFVAEVSRRMPGGNILTEKNLLLVRIVSTNDSPTGACSGVATHDFMITKERAPAIWEQNSRILKRTPSLQKIFDISENAERTHGKLMPQNFASWWKDLDRDIELISHLIYWLNWLR